EQGRGRGRRDIADIIIRAFLRRREHAELVAPDIHLEAELFQHRRARGEKLRLVGRVEAAALGAPARGIFLGELQRLLRDLARHAGGEKRENDRREPPLSHRLDDSARSAREANLGAVRHKNLTKSRQPFTSIDLMVEVRGLTKYYGDFRAIHDVTFTAEHGEILGLLGPNGAGKTTTMRIVTGFMPATEGTVSVEGFDVVKEAREARRRIGYLPENPPLYHDMTVSSYLKFVGRIKGVAKSELDDALERVLDKCFLTDVADRIVSRLSKGYRQRVGLAGALIHNPPVLILDEPTIGLDPKQIIEIRTLIKELAGDRTVILSTHILPEVSQICSKVVIINEGTVAVEKSLKELAQGASLEEVFLRYISKESAAAAV